MVKCSEGKIAPKITIIICTYNMKKYICESIDSVLSQTYRDYEIVVVDDGSTDNTRDILKKYDSKIKYLYQENSGQAKARMLALSESRGKYIALIDADDIWLPEKLQKQIEFMELCLDLDIIFSNFCNFNEKGISKQSYFYDNAAFKKIPLDAVLSVKQSYRKLVGDITYYYLKGNFILPSTMLINKETCIKLDLLNSKFMPREMYSFFVKNMPSIKLGFIDEVLTYRRIHENNITYNDSGRFYTNTIEISNIAINYPWLDKRSRDFLKKEVPKSYFKLGVLYFVKGKLSEARIEFVCALKSPKYFFPAFSMLCLSYIVPLKAIFLVKKTKNVFFHGRNIIKK
jgi:glycosyltransferase involved in cell wall biosynthesis